jgi:gluconate 2-dehydrogenase gamma chain
MSNTAEPRSPTSKYAMGTNTPASGRELQSEEQRKPTNPSVDSRRSFLLSTGAVVTASWLSANWSDIAAAAQHAGHVAAAPTHSALEFLSVEDAEDVAAIAAQIVPSGPIPGAREAHVVYFVDRALATFFSDRGPAFRSGLAEFQAAFRISRPTIVTFSKASSDEQIEFLKSVDRSELFESMRVLTVLGMFSAPQYAGNYAGTGWKLLGFEDRHAFAPPFGHYDAHYTGFIPYSEHSKS